MNERDFRYWLDEDQAEFEARASESLYAGWDAPLGVCANCGQTVTRAEYAGTYYWPCFSCGFTAYGKELQQ